MFVIYQLFYIIFIFFYMLVFAFKKRRREGIAMRFGIYPDHLKNKLGKGKNIWIHAVSVGEVMVAKTLLDKIRKDLGQYDIVISTVTETGNSVARRIMGSDASIIYLPLDLTFAIERAIKAIRPVIFIIIETEIWPNLIRVLYRKKVPILLSNGRISPNSHKWYKLIRPILKNILNYITLLLMRTKEDADKIISLGAHVSKVAIAGNMKFDNVDFYVDEEQRQKMRELLKLEHRKLIVAGSTHPGEEDILLKVYSKITKAHNDISLLIAPRHIERAEDIAKLIKSYGFTPVRISQLTPNSELRTPNYPVYILDTMGQLKLFYSLAWLVFVGGSLARHGGQNMIEPACFGKPVLFGPHTFNFRDVAYSFLDKKGALMVKDESSLKETIEMLYGNEGFAKETGKHAQEIVRINQGAVTKTVNAIKTLLYKEDAPFWDTSRVFLFGASLITGQDANKVFYLLFRPLLLTLSFVYVNAVGLIRFFYKINILKSVKPKSKVVSVGNITWGGTGKTTLVALLSKFLDAKNKRPAILIRGYGEDEDRMLRQQLDTVVLSGKNRIKNVREAEDKYNADVLILDDGFQHWRIKRDLDIVTINATNPFGNGGVIPAGILREPLSALKRADIIILTKVNLIDKEVISAIKNIIYSITPEAEIFEAEYQPISLTETSKNQELGLDYIAGKKVCAVAAIGDNNSFFKMLLGLGAQITAKFSFPDHHKYTQRNIKDIVDTAKRTHSDAIITTPKDWVRLKNWDRYLIFKSWLVKKNWVSVPNFSNLSLNITIKIKDEEKFFRRISTLLNC